MYENSTGTQIVAEIAGGREWWQLRAGDVAPWVKSLHPSAVQELNSRTEWIGEAWDGVSDIAVGQATVTADDATLLLEALARGIRRLKLPGVAAPDAGSVRTCLFAVGGRQTLAIDVDMGDFVLPLGVDEWALADAREQPIASVADRMVGHVAHAARLGGRIHARELRLRRALEETAAAIGDGVAPLWLRMDPVALQADPKDLPYQQYVMLVLLLNDCLKWSPVGSERISTVKDVRGHAGWFVRQQRRRAAALAEMQARRSVGWISEVALALIEGQGLDPRAVFDQAVAARLADFRGGVQFLRNGRRETLYHVDGALQATFEFEGGHYHIGQLTLWGDWPEQLAIGAKGRPLAAYVDHPALHSTGVTVTKGSIRRQAMDLDHRIRLIPIEDAGRSVAARPVALAA